MNIPTAEEFFIKYSDNTSLSEGYYEYLVDKDSFKGAMIEFAKLHVEAALQEGKKKAEEIMSHSWEKEYEDSILNSYPLTNIK